MLDCLDFSACLVHWLAIPMNATSEHEQPEQTEQPRRHYIADNEAHFAFKNEWKKIPGNRFTAEELTFAGDWQFEEPQDVVHWPCP